MIKIRFGDYLLDEARYALLRSGKVVALRPKAFDLLLHLVRHADRVVRREELVHVVWGGTRVGAGSLAGLVNELRRALGERGRGESVIRTVHARGYQFVGRTRNAANEVSSAADPVAAIVAEATRHASAIGPFGIVLERLPPSPDSDEGGAPRALEAFALRGFEIHRIRSRAGMAMTPGHLSRAIVESLIAQRSREAVAAALPLPARRWLETRSSEPVAGGQALANSAPPGGLTAVAAAVARCAGASPLVLVVDLFEDGPSGLESALPAFFRALGTAPVVVVVLSDPSAPSSCLAGSLARASGFHMVVDMRDEALHQRRALEAWRRAWALESIPAPIEAALIGHLRGDRPLLCGASPVADGSRRGVAVDPPARASAVASDPAQAPPRPEMRRVESAQRRRRAEGDVR